MEAAISQSKRKMWVVVNYLALILLLASFYAADRIGFTTLSIVAGCFAVLMLAISFIVVFGQTGLWRFVHTRVERLDEREIMVTYESLRHSYGFFTVICLVIFLVAELLRDNLLGGRQIPLMPMIAALIYLAHILPASVIAWRERDIYRE